MTFPRLILIISIILFGAIGFAAYFKNQSKKSNPSYVNANQPIPVDIESDPSPIIAASTNSSPTDELNKELSHQIAIDENSTISQQTPSLSTQTPVIIKPQAPIPTADRINEFFNVNPPQFPIVETITYKSRVPWLKGRPAWLSDYASHYKTSRHYIARSLNGKANYLEQTVAEGDRFAVLNPDKDIAFHLLIDMSRAKLWFYYHDIGTNERVLVKTYDVGLGRVDGSKGSGFLTPLGQYTLGNKIATYKPKVMGTRNGEKIEMITVFGSRWIPFEKEIGPCTAPAKGFGLHGVPWAQNPKTGKLEEDLSSIGKYESDGCIRLATADIEEIFAIVITRPTTITLVKDFYDAKLPGIEKE